MDSQVVNRVQPLIDEAAIEAARLDAEQRRAALQREEDARRMRDAAIVAGYNRAPDRPAVDATITDPSAPQVMPDIPAAPFTTVGLDETALRTMQAAGVELSPSTGDQVKTLTEERAAHEAAGRDAGGVFHADAAERAPDDTQSNQTASSSQTAEPNQPNQPDQPSRPNEPNVPAAMSSGTAVADGYPVDDGSGPGEEAPPDSYEGESTTRLREIARERDIVGRSGMTREQLIASLEAHDAG